MIGDRWTEQEQCRMKVPALLILILTWCGSMVPGLLTSVNGQTGSADDVVIREIHSGVDHNHSTTRQFQHKTFYHEGIWFVFYSDGNDLLYQTFDDDGKTCG